jgi:hypothetical protein
MDTRLEFREKLSEYREERHKESRVPKHDGVVYST